MGARSEVVAQSACSSRTSAAGRGRGVDEHSMQPQQPEVKNHLWFDRRRRRSLRPVICRQGRPYVTCISTLRPDADILRDDADVCIFSVDFARVVRFTRRDVGRTGPSCMCGHYQESQHNEIWDAPRPSCRERRHPTHGVYPPPASRDEYRPLVHLCTHCSGTEC